MGNYSGPSHFEQCVSLSAFLHKAILHRVRSPKQTGIRQHVETRLTFGKCQNLSPKTGEEIKKEDCSFSRKG